MQGPYQMIEDITAWSITIALTFMTLGPVFAWNNWTVWHGQSLVTFAPAAEWATTAAAAPDAAPAARAAHAAEAAAVAAVPGPDSDSEEEPHWRQLGFELDDGGHWVPQGYFDEVEDRAEPGSESVTITSRGGPATTTTVSGEREPPRAARRR